MLHYRYVRYEINEIKCNGKFALSRDLSPLPKYIENKRITFKYDLNM